MGHSDHGKMGLSFEDSFGRNVHKISHVFYPFRDTNLYTATHLLGRGFPVQYDACPPGDQISTLPSSQKERERCHVERAREKERKRGVIQTLTSRGLVVVKFGPVCGGRGKRHGVTKYGSRLKLCSTV